MKTKKKHTLFQHFHVGDLKSHLLSHAAQQLDQLYPKPEEEEE